MYRSKFEENELEILNQSLINSSKVNRTLFLSYLFFLFSICFSIFSIESIDFFINKEIKFLFINIAMKTYDFVEYIPYVIVVFHFFLVLSFVSHYKRVEKFFQLNTNMTFKSEKEIYLYPFFLNDQALYLKNKNLEIQFLNMCYFLILGAFPIITLLFISSYNLNFIQITLFMLFCSIMNFCLLRIFKVKLAKKVLLFLIVFCFLPTISIFVNFYIDSAKRDYEIEKAKSKKDDLEDKKSSFLLEILDKYNNVVFQKQIFSRSINNKIIENKKLNNYLLYRTNLQSSNFYYSELNRFIFRDLKIDNTNFINVKINNTDFYNVTVDNIKVEGIHFDFSNGLLQDEKNIFTYKSILKDIDFYGKNIIKNSIFENLNVKDIFFYGETSFINTKFISNEYENINFRNVKFNSVVFSGSTLGIEEKEYENEKNRIMNNEHLYRKDLHDFSLMFANMKMFDESLLNNVEFNNIKIKNLLFYDTIFSDIKISKNTSFENTIFLYRSKNIDKEVLAKNENFFKSIKRCNNCKYVDFINKKVLINNNGVVIKENKPLSLYNIK